MIELVDFDKKANVPTFYAATSLLFTALLLGYIAFVQKRMNRDYKHWLGLCVLFIFLSIDEAVSIHQLFFSAAKKMEHHFFIYFSLIAFFGLLACGLLLFCIKFLLRFAYRLRVIFLLAVLIYISGAIVIDTLLSSYYGVGDIDNFGYALGYTLEELLEMIGVAVFIYSLLLHAQDMFSGRHVRLVIKGSVINFRPSRSH